MAGILKALKLTGSSLLVATAEHDVNVYKSARNIDGVDVAPVAGLNALNLLRPRRVLMTKAALEAVRSAAKKSKGPTKRRSRPSAGQGRSQGAAKAGQSTGQAEGSAKPKSASSHRDGEVT